jgi:hypothetical protein
MGLYAQIRVAIGKDTFIGTVRHCAKNPLGFYIIGVKLKPEDAIQATPAADTSKSQQPPQ